jgi:farnesyl diphosphate synthase
MTNNAPAPLSELMSAWQARAEQALDARLPAAHIHPARLHEAMRYSATNGGKRLRPILTYATGHALNVAAEHLDGPACAVELIHAYSLVHDDLPAMDNDDLRRGKPTCHRAYDEATAILVGDALQTQAFYILAHDPAMRVEASARLAMIEALTIASGSRGMAGGQAIDLAAVGKNLGIAELEDMHIHKTGALIRAAVKLGALSAPGIDKTTLDHLDHYAKCIGLAFQIRDDILDIEGDTATLGKPQGSDQARNKPTYPSILGMNEAKELATDLHEKAITSLAPYGPAADPLRWISEYIVRRDR